MPPFYTDIGSVYAASPPINSAQVLTGLSSAVVLGYINQVEADINSKIGGRYQLPFSNGCPVLGALALREAIYMTSVERGLVHQPAPMQARSPLAVRHEADQKFLDRIMDGEITLLDSSLQVIDPVQTGRGEIWSNNQEFVPTFGEGAMVDQVQDQTKLEADLAERLGRGL